MISLQYDRRSKVVRHSLKHSPKPQKHKPQVISLKSQVTLISSKSNVTSQKSKCPHQNIHINQSLLNRIFLTILYSSKIAFWVLLFAMPDIASDLHQEPPQTTSHKSLVRGHKSKVTSQNVPRRLP